MKTFENVAGLTAARLTTGQIVSTKGYTAAGDGGQAEYLIVAPQAFDSYGDHGLANGNVAVLQSDGSVSVKQFGAVGDGVANDAAFFNAAWSASDPQAVYVPAQSYAITGTVTGKFYSFGLVSIVGGTVTTITNLVPQQSITTTQGYQPFVLNKTDVDVLMDNEDNVERRAYKQLTDEELNILREMIKSEQHMRWLWSTLRNSAVWVVAIITGVTLGYNALADTIKHLVGK